MKLDRTARRVLGSLIEKRWTTPDAYPLSLNALVAACNQKSNRDPVLEVAEFEVSGCLLSLREKGLIMLHERDGGRVPRYGERLSEQLNLSRTQAAVLAELMLRGPQTAGELLRRGKRMAQIRRQDEVDDVLRDFASRLYVTLLPKGSGQRYARWGHLLAPDREDDGDAFNDDETVTATASSPFVSPHAASVAPSVAAPAVHTPVPVPTAVPAAEPAEDVQAEISALREELAVLRERVETLEDLIT